MHSICWLHERNKEHSSRQAKETDADFDEPALNNIELIIGFPANNKNNNSLKMLMWA